MKKKKDFEKKKLGGKKLWGKKFGGGEIGGKKFWGKNWGEKIWDTPPHADQWDTWWQNSELQVHPPTQISGTPGGKILNYWYPPGGR